MTEPRSYYSLSHEDQVKVYQGFMDAINTMNMNLIPRYLRAYYDIMSLKFKLEDKMVTASQYGAYYMHKKFALPNDSRSFEIFLEMDSKCCGW